MAFDLELAYTAPQTAFPVPPGLTISTEKRIMKRLSVPVLLLLAVASLGAQQTPPAEGAAAAQAPAATEPPAGDEKVNIWAGYKKAADLKRTAWLTLQEKTLVLVDKLGNERPNGACRNEKLIAKHIEALRLAANDWIASYRVYLEKWSEYTQKDIEENRKWWADMAARQSDIPGAIKAEEEAIKEYQRRQANLSADDEAARREFETLISKANAKLDQLRTTEKDAQSIDSNIKLSGEYWAAKLENIKKDGELVETAQQAYQKRYDAIVQQWKTVCSGGTAPTTMQDLGLEKKK